MAPVEIHVATVGHLEAAAQAELFARHPHGIQLEALVANRVAAAAQAHMQAGVVGRQAHPRGGLPLQRELEAAGHRAGDEIDRVEQLQVIGNQARCAYESRQETCVGDAAHAPIVLREGCRIEQHTRPQLAAIAQLECIGDLGP